MKFRVGLACVCAALLLTGFTGCNEQKNLDGPAPLPTPAAPAAGVLGDGRLPELVEWARASQNAPAMGVVVIRHGVMVERAVSGLRSAQQDARVALDDQWHLG